MNREAEREETSRSYECRCLEKLEQIWCEVLTVIAALVVGAVYDAVVEYLQISGVNNHEYFPRLANERSIVGPSGVPSIRFVFVVVLLWW